MPLHLLKHTRHFVSKHTKRPQFLKIYLQRPIQIFTNLIGSLIDMMEGNSIEFSRTGETLYLPVPPTRTVKTIFDRSSQSSYTSARRRSWILPIGMVNLFLLGWLSSVIVQLNVPVDSRYDCHVSRSLSLNSTYNYYFVYFILQIEYNYADRQFHLRQLDDCIAPSSKKRKIADMPGDFKDAIVKMVSSGAQPSNIVRAMKFFPPERQKTFFDPAIFKYLGGNQLWLLLWRRRRRRGDSHRSILHVTSRVSCLQYRTCSWCRASLS